jgi:predicted dehydrogenase
MGGGVVLTQCHALDYLPWLVGDVESVWGFTAKLGDLEVDVEDTAKIGLRFANGALGSVHLDYNRQPPVHRGDIVGTRGTIKWDLADGAVHLHTHEKNAWESYPLPAGWERNVMFMEEMRHFISVVRGEAGSSCPLEAGIKVQRLIEAVHRSSKTRMAATI